VEGDSDDLRFRRAIERSIFLRRISFFQCCGFGVTCHMPMHHMSHHSVTCHTHLQLPLPQQLHAHAVLLVRVPNSSEPVHVFQVRIRLRGINTEFRFQIPTSPSHLERDQRFNTLVVLAPRRQHQRRLQPVALPACKRERGLGRLGV